MAIPVSVVRVYRVSESNRPGMGAVLRVGDATWYCSRLDGQCHWYVDTVFPSDGGPALHKNGWGARNDDMRLYPMRSDLEGCLEAFVTAKIVITATLEDA